MVKSVLGVNRGLRDWLWQRVSAVFMAICVIGLFVFLAIHSSDFSYDLWRSLFTQLWVKIATILFFFLLMAHAWIGMWTVFTDYITCSIGRLVLHTIVLLALAGFFFATLLILWGV